MRHQLRGGGHGGKYPQSDIFSLSLSPLSLSLFVGLFVVVVFFLLVGSEYFPFRSSRTYSDDIFFTHGSEDIPILHVTPPPPHTHTRVLSPARGGGVLRFGSDGGVPLKPPNPYPSLRVILAVKGTHY